MIDPEQSEDPAEILRDHLTNLPPVTRRVVERVLLELQERRKIFPPAPSEPLQETARAASKPCARCAESERLAVELLAVFRGDQERARVAALETLRVQAERLRETIDKLQSEPTVG